METEQPNQYNPIRFSWNSIPTSKSSLDTTGIPFGCVYTPLKELRSQEQILNYQPCLCPNCKGIINPFSTIDPQSKTWICPLCKQRAPLPLNYTKTDQNNVPAELSPENTTVEYLIEENENPVPPVYFFVVDVCCTEKQHQQLKNLLLQTLACIPNNALVGFISFGTIISVHEVYFEETPHISIFNGTKVYTAEELKKFLKINPISTGIPNRFIAPLKDAEQMLNTIIDQLDPDPYPIPKGNRVKRCTGAAIHMAVGIIEATFPKTGGHVIVFSGGPITHGPGAMAELERIKNVRQLSDISKSKLTEESLKFFTELGNRANSSNISVNYIAASFEETGFHEVEPLVTATGGFHTIGEGWADADLIETVVRYFQREAPYSGSEAIVTINGSSHLNVTGMIGCGIANPPVNNFFSINNKVGLSGTDQWRIVGLRRGTSLGIFLDSKGGVNGEKCFIQLLCRYRYFVTGKTHLRVTTAAVSFDDNLSSQLTGFDQEAGISLLGRLAMFKIRSETVRKVIDEVDSSIVEFYKKYAPGANFNKNTIGIPQLIFYLRRLKVFTSQNTTPDLTASIRCTFNILDPNDSALLLVPILRRYCLGKEVEEMPLSQDSLDPQWILVLTCFSRVVVCCGRDVASWRNQNIHEQPGHEDLKLILEKSQADAKNFADLRFPAPQFIVCDQDSSLSRYLLTAVNPPPLQLEAKKSANSLDTDSGDYGSFVDRLRQLSK